MIFFTPEMLRRSRLALLGLVAMLSLASPSPLPAAEPPRRSNPARFEAVDAALRQAVETSTVAGAVALVIQDGQTVYSATRGAADMQANRPMAPDTIFRIASMTKPLTSVAVMMLFEQGDLKLDDPLSKFIPEFASMQVIMPEQTGPAELQPARRQITLHDLLTHTSGLPYDFLSPPAVAACHREFGVATGLMETPHTLKQNVVRLARCPLATQPGAAWQYGLSTDVLGRVVEIVSGKSLDAFLSERILQPLEMTDTHFFLPQEKRNRLATLYQPAADGLVPVGQGPQHANGVDFSSSYPLQRPQVYASGGAGLVSTARDYGRFLQMLLNRGELDGVRLLQPETVALMTSNQIGDLEIAFAVHGTKFGYGFGIHTEQGDRHGAAVGSYSWGGIFHTYFWVDPEAKLIGMVLTQLFPNDHSPLWVDFQEAVYASVQAPAER